LEQAETEIADLQADPNNEFDEEQGEAIRSRAATSTNGKNSAFGFQSLLKD
jgi:hypothetical protein